MQLACLSQREGSWIDSTTPLTARTEFVVPKSMPTDPDFSALLLHFVVRRKCKRDLCRL